jgi:hypothetical protein
LRLWAIVVATLAFRSHDRFQAEHVTVMMASGGSLLEPAEEPMEPSPSRVRDFATPPNFVGIILEGGQGIATIVLLRLAGLGQNDRHSPATLGLLPGESHLCRDYGSASPGMPSRRRDQAVSH